MEFFKLVDCNLAGGILILPAVSVGNVAQLSMDLLINSFPFEKVGFIEDPNVYPVAGSDAFQDSNSSSGLSVELEVFHWKEKSLTLLQQRSPVLKRQAEAYVDNLIGWIQKEKFNEIILLTGADASRRFDSQLVSQQLRYVCSTAFNQGAISTLPQFTYLEESKDMEEDYRQDDGNAPKLSGAGMTKHLFKKCDALKIPLLVMIFFTNEGDNVPGSLVLANHVNTFLGLIPDENEIKEINQVSAFSWKPPTSWKVLFGSMVNTSMYL